MERGGVHKVMTTNQ